MIRKEMLYGSFLAHYNRYIANRDILKASKAVLSGLLGLAQGIFRATGAEKDYKEKIRH